jgi:putative nucleotidyltransferase with HDIG domain
MKNSKPGQTGESKPERRASASAAKGRWSNKVKADKYKEPDSRRQMSSMTLRLILLLCMITAYTVCLYPNLGPQSPSYNPGDVADRDIKAPRDFFIEDSQATRANRDKAVDQVLTVYDFNAGLGPEVAGRVQKAFADLRSVIRQQPEPTQSVQIPDGNGAVGDAPTDPERIWQLKGEFESLLGIEVSDGAYRILEREAFSEQISRLIVEILSAIYENGVVADKEGLLRHSDTGITVRTIATGKEEVVNVLRPYYGLDQAKTMVRVIGQPLVKDMNYNLINLVVDFCQRLIQPNLTLNRNETEARKRAASESVKPVLYKIKKGEMLLREGERVTDFQLLKLKALHQGQEKERILSSGVGAAMILSILLIAGYFLYRHQFSPRRPEADKNLVFIGCTLLFFFFFAQISSAIGDQVAHSHPYGITESAITFGIPLAAAGMLFCLFLNLQMAIPLSLLLAASTAATFDNRFEIFFYFFASSAMAAYWIQNCRERTGFITAGVKTGLLNMLLATAVIIYTGDYIGFKVLWDCAFAFLGGVGASIIALGLAPLIEMVFGYRTEITLLELANLDRPILRRLMIEAPGTYHHSVIVGSMVEAAASEIGANPLLAKVCGYYHDIGKIKKPLYFIENQMGGTNRHDKLAPSMSSLILIAHVKDGVEIAREHKLGQQIIDSIKQHHGTSLISYFYEKARQQRGEDAVKIDDFRYPGPRPQTKEAGLVMLADIVEAASRTLYNPTPSRVKGLVGNLINKVFSDNQLDNCELTLKDLHSIAKTFTKILTGIHHHRIEYSETVTRINGKGKNGSTHRQSAKPADSNRDDPPRGKGHLKRLGQS